MCRIAPVNTDLGAGNTGTVNDGLSTVTNAVNRGIEMTDLDRMIAKRNTCSDPIIRQAYDRIIDGLKKDKSHGRVEER